MASGRPMVFPGAMYDWDGITATARHQHGVVSRRQLYQGGVTRYSLGRLIEQGRLEPCHPRVYRIGGAPETPRQRLHAGLLALGSRSWVSHEAAAELHRFDRRRHDQVEFLVLRNHRDVDIGETVHSTRRWSKADVVDLDGLRVTSATRTIIDLANVQIHPDRLMAAIDSAVRLELSSPETLHRRLTAIRSRGRTGVRLLDRLLENSGGHTMLERKFLELMDRAGLPRPTPQVVYRTERTGKFVARVDFSYPDHGLVVEVSGRKGHSSPSERARDAQRRNELQELGVRVFEFTWEDVTERHGYVINSMRRLLADAS